ncbi:N-acetylgalactosamine kinase [Cichlidogyrus casuarinus]|uniref:N-acetylgalactosamine kinase n=1 Tax=Cichlidogyrus casuarinus TaxID=1844966 RepID=A0ABD2Q0X5_9PLAT
MTAILRGDRASDESVTRFLSCAGNDYKFEFIVKSPGRVNIIGEHIDYSGYSVLPITLSQAIFIGVETKFSENDSKRIHLRNLDSNFAPHDLDLNDVATFGNNGPPSPPFWHHYMQCGMRGVLDRFGIQSIRKQFQSRSVTIVVGSAGPEYTIPHSAGLSSSSALVVASALAFLHLIKKDLVAVDFANLCATAEKYIGTQGGGMDQAACILGIKDCALLIDFSDPSSLNHKPVSLPVGIVFVVADSKTRLNKAATTEFNVRVTECRLACALLMTSSKKRLASSKPRLVDVQKDLGFSTPYEMLSSKIIDEILTNNCTRQQVNDLLSPVYQEPDAVTRFLPDNLKSTELPLLKLHSRIAHALNEAIRVDQFHKLAQKGTNETLPQLGNLMNASHESCKSLYECSHPEVDRLVDCCRLVLAHHSPPVFREAGAFGSRLTGAGWGGCVISMVSEAHIVSFLAKLNEKFYGITGENVKNPCVFVSKPSQGATIFS